MGDCQMLECDGNGAIVEVIDDTNVPPAPNVCTSATCNAGVPTFTDVAEGSVCGPGAICNGQGACVGCVFPTDCPVQDTACATPTCTNGVCGANDAPSGTPLPPAQQIAGNCMLLECDGNGNTVSVVDDTNVPVDGNDCTSGVCTNGVPSNPPLAAGSTCTQNGGSVCDGAGNCVQCIAAANCPGPSTACEAPSCTAGACGLSFTPAGTALPSAQQVVGNCMLLECDGNGNTVSVIDDGNVPVDGNDCTGDVCTDGVPSNPILPTGTACTQNGGEVCDPNGKCNRLLAYVQFGNGVTSRSATSAAVFIDYVYADGTPAQASTALPTTATAPNAAFSNSGSATSEGHLARSIDTHFVTLVGYATPPGLASVNTSASSTVNRVVARVDAAGNIDTSTLFNAAFSANNPRSAVTIDGSEFWVSGAGGTGIGGVWYAPIGATGSATQITGQVSSNPPNNARVLGIFGDQLFGTAMTGAFNSPFSIGVTPPPTATTAATVLSGTSASGTGTPSPYGFVFFDLDETVAGFDTLYVADDRATASGGGIQKWQLGTGGTWTLAATFNQGLTAGCRGLTGWLSGTSVVLAAVTADTSSNLVVTTDNGSATPVFTTLATAPPNTAFRGVALAPM